MVCVMDILDVRIVKEGLMLGYMGYVLGVKSYVMGYLFFDVFWWGVVINDFLCSYEYVCVIYLVSVFFY